MNTFQWVIPQDSMVTAKSIDGLSNVVVTINALREISDEGILVQTPVCLGLTPPIEGFIPYEQLTKDVVEGWLNAGTDTESLDAQLVSKLDNIKNPKTQVLPNPF